jgi:hypothetical protein
MYQQIHGLNTEEKGLESVKSDVISKRNINESQKQLCQIWTCKINSTKCPFFKSNNFRKYPKTKARTIDLFPNEQNFDLDKSRQRFYHSLKVRIIEHCEVCSLSVILYYAREIVTAFWKKISRAYKCKMTEKRQTSQGYIIRILQHFATKLWNITNFVMLFQAVMKSLSRLV